MDLSKLELSQPTVGTSPWRVVLVRGGAFLTGVFGPLAWGGLLYPAAPASLTDRRDDDLVGLVLPVACVLLTAAVLAPLLLAARTREWGAIALFGVTLPATACLIGFITLLVPPLS